MEEQTIAIPNKQSFLFILFMKLIFSFYQKANSNAGMEGIEILNIYNIYKYIYLSALLWNV